MRFLIIPLLLVLSGCTVVDAYFMAKFDSNEYQLINQIKSASEVNISNCDDREKMNNVVEYIYVKGTEFKNYTSDIPHNEKATALSSDLYQLITGLHNRYADPKKISPSYCKTKLSAIEESAKTIHEVIGDKPRWIQFKKF